MATQYAPQQYSVTWQQPNQHTIRKAIVRSEPVYSPDPLTSLFANLDMVIHEMSLNNGSNNKKAAKSANSFAYAYYNKRPNPSWLLDFYDLQVGQTSDIEKALTFNNESFFFAGKVLKKMYGKEGYLKGAYDQSLKFMDHQVHNAIAFSPRLSRNERHDLYTQQDQIKGCIRLIAHTLSYFDDTMQKKTFK